MRVRLVNQKAPRASAKLPASAKTSTPRDGEGVQDEEEARGYLKRSLSGGMIRALPVPAARS